MGADPFGNGIWRQSEKGKDDRIDKNTEIDTIIIKAKIFCKIVWNGIGCKRVISQAVFDTMQGIHTYIGSIHIEHKRHE